MPDLLTPTKLYASTYAQIGSLLTEPDSQIIEIPKHSPDYPLSWYQIFTPSVKDGSHNEVSISHFGGASDSEIEAKVRETLAKYKRAGVPLKWLVGPMSSPSQLETILRPLASTEWWFRGMAFNSSVPLELLTPLAENIFTEPVTESNYTEFVDVFLKGWGREAYREHISRWNSPNSPVNSRRRYFLARKNGVAIGTAGTVMHPGYGYLVGAVILEKFRGLGAYRALVQARLKDLASLEIPFAVTMAREATSAPILEKLGAETTYRAQVFRFDP